MTDINSLTKPYVGLRPFESYESELFFGREEQTKRLLSKLHQTNFVAVVGSSGSGKSSLVKAGLIPALKAGFLNKGDHWFITSFRPGDNPIYYFAKSLKETFELTVSATELEKSIQLEGTDVVDEIVRPRLANTGSSLLILVDQFEELFTHFKQNAGQAALMFRFEFVKMILELVECKLPIYVIITMRSDFIGKCNIFYGLPEALSNSQFLVPRLQGNELFTVIEGPVKLFGSTLEPGLTQKILNDLKEGDDQLPVLEHSLSQLWNARKSPDIITSKDYEGVGKLKDALSKQANVIYSTLVQRTPSLGTTIKEMFQYIIDFDGEKKEGVRQPRKVKDIQRVTGGSFDDIKTIYEAFSADNACFLFSPSAKQLHEESLIDISHESLMREWDLFKKWKEEEERDKRIVERLNDFATEFNEAKREVLRGSELAIYSNWGKYLAFKDRSRRQKIVSWANRYGVDFNAVNAYISKSKRRQQFRRLLIWSLVGVVLAGVIGFYVHEQKTKAETALLKADKLKSQQKVDSLALVNATEANLRAKEASIVLASQSSAQEALFKAQSENEQLRSDLKSLEIALKERERAVQNFRQQSPVDESTKELMYQKEIADHQRLVAERNYAQSVKVIDSLQLVIASYRKYPTKKK